MAQNIFLTYSNHSKKLLSLQGKAVKHFYNFFTSHQSEPFAISYYSNIRDLFILNVHALLVGYSDISKTLVMHEQSTYILHSISTPCNAKDATSSPPPVSDDFTNEILSTYKHRNAKQILQSLKPFIASDLCVKFNDNTFMHICDILNIMLIPVPKKKLSSSQIKFFKQLKLANIRWPITAIKNPQIRKMFNM